MYILVDTREQKPLEFNPEEILSQKLDIADYGAVKDGVYCPIYFERKSIADLFSTLTKGHERFKRELERAKRDNKKIILVIECNYSKLYKGIKWSKLKGSVIIKILMTMYHKYDLQHIFFKNREEMKDYIKRFYEGWFKNEKEKAKKK